MKFKTTHLVLVAAVAVLWLMHRRVHSQAAAPAGGNAYPQTSLTVFR